MLTVNIENSIKAAKLFICLVECTSHSTNELTPKKLFRYFIEGAEFCTAIKKKLR